MDAAGGRECDEAEVQNLKDGDAQEREDDARPYDVCLMKAGMLGPATDVEGVGGADEEVDDVQEKGIAGCKAPRKQNQGEHRDEIGSERNEVIAEPSVAVGNITLVGVHFESIDFSDKEDGKNQMREFVREFHQPTEGMTKPRKQEYDKESDEADGKEIVQQQSMRRGCLHLNRLHKNRKGNNQNGKQRDTSDDVHRFRKNLPYVLFLFHPCKVTFLFKKIIIIVYLYAIIVLMSVKRIVICPEEIL